VSGLFALLAFKARRDLSDSLATLKPFFLHMSLSQNRFTLLRDMLRCVILNAYVTVARFALKQASLLFV
jgi:hypothetical protein